MKNLSDLLLVWLGGLVIISLAAVFQKSPGYMDAEYYYAGGKLLWQGAAFREPYVWNYLADPKSLPVPAFTYWMPLASILAWLGMSVAGKDAFEAARFPFILLSSFIPPLTYHLSGRISGQRFMALFSGLLAWLPMFYLAYLPTTDTFGVYMVLGTFWFLLAEKIPLLNKQLAFLAGIVSGLMHLARADGLIWMLIYGTLLMIPVIKKQRQQNSGYRIGVVLLFCLGYMMVMGGWYARNWMEFQSLFPPGNYRSLFLRTYNDLFRYPAIDLNFENWVEDGLVPLIQDRLYALGQNFQSLVAVQMQILLLPLSVLGYWKMRAKPMIRIATLVWLAMVGLMSVVFPFAGWRGGYFHVSAAFQPMVWCLASEGLAIFVNWGVRKRSWNASQALRVFSLFIFGFLLILTLYLYQERVIGKDLHQPLWEESQQSQEQICRAVRNLVMSDKLNDLVVMINNPIGFYLACEQPAVSVPVGGERAVQGAAQQFGVRLLVLEKDHPDELAHLFYAPRSTSLFELIDNQPEWKIYRLHESP
ncbi:MAG: hypothetical protein DDG59_06495 [Anaerolineae bacterium]|jgi:hypothetical protein|nr:MAG: hypothetical protein DDG59_06495 [Anaerolineae bacterium]